MSIVVAHTHTDAAPRWAPAGTAAIHPGVQVDNGNSICTAGFVFTDGKRVFISIASHCTGAHLDADECPNVFRTGGTVKLAGASSPPRIAYSAWDVMLREHRLRGTPCTRAHDLALLEIEPRDRAKVNPSVPSWGGPTGVASGVQPGDVLYTYGRSRYRFGIDQLSPQIGINTANDGDGRGFRSVSLTPSIFGDSGSAILDANGAALGTFLRLDLPRNHNTLLAPALAYMYEHTDLDRVKLARGTIPFSGTPTG